MLLFLKGVYIYIYIYKIYYKCLIYIYFQVAAKQGVTEDALYEEAKAILEEMGHNQNMTNLRCLGVFFAKTFKALLQHIYVNPSGIQKVCLLSVNLKGGVTQSQAFQISMKFLLQMAIDYTGF